MEGLSNLASEMSIITGRENIGVYRISWDVFQISWNSVHLYTLIDVSQSTYGGVS